MVRDVSEPTIGVGVGVVASVEEGAGQNCPPPLFSIVSSIQSLRFGTLA